VDLRDLAPLYENDGPFVTVVLDTTSEVEDAAARVEIAWKNVLRELGDRGVDEATREALSYALGDHGQGNSRVLVAAHGEVLLAVSLPEPPERQLVELGPLPSLLPLVERASLQLPHVVVVADRTGADVLAYGGSDDTPTETAEVTGPRQHHLTKVHSGGWAHRRMQQRAENFWERNAGEVVSAVDALAADVDARLVVGTGDETALHLVADRLPERLKPVWTMVPGGRAEDGSGPHVARRVTEAVAERLRVETDELLADYARERGQNDLGVEGQADVLAALRMSQVDTLIVTTELPADATAWFGPEPAAVGLGRDEVVALGVEKPVQAPLVDVLLRAALGTAATVRVVPGDREDAPRSGVGALLRFPVADTTVS
jgi:hypothetical protein